MNVDLRSAIRKSWVDAFTVNVVIQASHFRSKFALLLAPCARPRYSLVPVRAPGPTRPSRLFPGCMPMYCANSAVLSRTSRATEKSSGFVSESVASILVLILYPIM